MNCCSRALVFGNSGTKYPALFPSLHREMRLHKKPIRANDVWRIRFYTPRRIAALHFDWSPSWNQTCRVISGYVLDFY
jgi:hypothetical protein